MLMVCRIGVYRVQVKRSLGACELEDHHDIVRALDDLKRVRHVHRAWSTRQKQSISGSRSSQIVEVLRFLFAPTAGSGISSPSPRRGQGAPSRSRPAPRTWRAQNLRVVIVDTFA